MMHTENLQLTLQGEREIVMTRAFRAPRRLVFDAWTKPELVQRWLGGGREGWSFVVCEIDLKVGGAYRFLWRQDADGMEMGMRGEYREIVAPERLVNTEVFDEPWYPGEALDTMVLVEQGDVTTMTITVRYASAEARAIVMQSGMEDGLVESFDKLAELLATMA